MTPTTGRPDAMTSSRLQSHLDLMIAPSASPPWMPAKELLIPTKYQPFWAISKVMTGILAAANFAAMTGSVDSGEGPSMTALHLSSTKISALLSDVEGECWLLRTTDAQPSWWAMSWSTVPCPVCHGVPGVPAVPMQTLKVLVAALAAVSVVPTTMASDVSVSKLPVITPASFLTV